MKAALLVALLVGALGTAQARVIDIEWDLGRRFETTVALAPGQPLEVCGKLDKGQAVSWSFRSDIALDFNIHYHAGAKVIYPVKRNATTRASGMLTVPLAQDYCWMWTHPGKVAATLTFSLQQRRP